MKSARLLTMAIGFGSLATVQYASGAQIIGSTAMLNDNPVSSFAEVNGSNQLTAVGFQLSGAAVRNPGAAGADLFFTLPMEAAATNFTTLGLDWNPLGHPPPGVYDVPHFDFHFYYIPDSVRNTIPGGQPVADPGAQFRPAGYSAPGATVPNMGGHSVDLTSPEWNGGSFTHTFIYGFYNGQEAFVEPMVTQAYLQGLNGASSFAIRQPAQYALPSLPSLVPNSVIYSYDAANDTYQVKLTEFTPATATPEPETISLVALSMGALAIWQRRRVRS